MPRPRGHRCPPSSPRWPYETSSTPARRNGHGDLHVCRMALSWNLIGGYTGYTPPSGQVGLLRHRWLLHRRGDEPSGLELLGRSVASGLFCGPATEPRSAYRCCGCAGTTSDRDPRHCRGAPGRSSPGGHGGGGGIRLSHRRRGGDDAHSATTASTSSSSPSRAIALPVTGVISAQQVWLRCQGQSTRTRRAVGINTTRNQRHHLPVRASLPGWSVAYAFQQATITPSAPV